MELLTSQEIKAVMKVSDCELMHLRMGGSLQYQKRGRAFFYLLPNGYSVLSHPLGKSLIDWHLQKHNFSGTNTPLESASTKALEYLVSEILFPIQRKFKTPNVTYGFTSAALKLFIQKHSPRGTSAILDQHASCEKNSKGKAICNRGGAACDFFVDGVSSADLVRYIVEHCEYDRIYYYGADRPVHVSVHLTNPQKHLQIMKTGHGGKRYPYSKAFAEDTIKLAESL